MCNFNVWGVFMFCVWNCVMWVGVSCVGVNVRVCVSVCVCMQMCVC